MPFARVLKHAGASFFADSGRENIVPDGELVGAKFGRLPEKSLSLPIRGEVLEWLKKARLESSYTSKAYQGFESPSLR